MGVKCFRYARVKTLTVDSALVVLVGIAVLAAMIIRRGERLAGFAVAICGYIVFLPLYINSRLLRSMICVDDVEISWNLLWFSWRRISWSNAKTIRVLKSYDIAARRELLTFTIDASPKRLLYFLPGGPIIFDETILDSRALRDIINTHAARYQIPILSFVAECGQSCKEPREIERL